MTKITGDHLTRSAYVYVRQSSMDQLLHNPESRRRQEMSRCLLKFSKRSLRIEIYAASAI